MIFRGLEYEKTDEGFVVTGASGRGKRRVTIPSFLGSVPVIGVGRGAFKGNDRVRRVKISPGVRFIESEAFKDAGCLKRVIFSTGLGYIGDGALSGVDNVKSVDIPASVKCIGDEAFWGATSLKKIVLREGLKTVGNGAFEYTDLKRVDFPKGFLKLGGRAFFSCLKLKKVSFMDGETEIGPSAFDGCSNLSEVRLPEGLKVLERYVFDDCGALKSVTLPESLEKMSPDAFSDDCGVERIFYEGTQSGWERVEGHGEIPSRIEVVITGKKEEKGRKERWKRTD